MMNDDKAQGAWTQLKGEIQKAWGNITGDELEQTKGDMKSIAGIIQQKYGMAKDDASRKLTEMSDSLKTKVADVTERTKDKLEQSQKDQKSQH